MDFLRCLPAHHLGAALRIPDVHVEEKLHNPVKDPAGELPAVSLLDMQH